MKNTIIEIIESDETPHHIVRKNVNAPFRFHKGYEFMFCSDGEVNVTIMDRIYRMRQGKCILIPPMQVHACQTPDFSKTHTCIFPREFAPDFCEEYANKESLFPVFDIVTPEKFCSRIQTLTNKYELQSALYYLIARYTQTGEFVDSDVKKCELQRAIITYINDNCTQDISLKQMAESLGYSYNYLSAAFNSAFHAGFPDVLNNYRIAQAERLLYTTDYSIAEIATHCGYTSIRSFNRNFIKYAGFAPTVAREIKKNSQTVIF